MSYFLTNYMIFQNTYCNIFSLHHSGIFKAKKPIYPIVSVKLQLPALGCVESSNYLRLTQFDIHKK